MNANHSSFLHDIHSSKYTVCFHQIKMTFYFLVTWFSPQRRWLHSIEYKLYFMLFTFIKRGWTKIINFLPFQTLLPGYHGNLTAHHSIFTWFYPGKWLCWWKVNWIVSLWVVDLVVFIFQWTKYIEEQKRCDFSYAYISVIITLTQSVLLLHTNQ